ncbi:Transcriptional adapter 3 [Armadillidium nasatum]|uniref:Transcriptional adapter 3 n=1 Tax=Armadillidium nasatum TaxID=96803 RepID=A0A5N5T148_9CRUS|nr:Transcriptional adapter 3 [Armadillidium nasatum]
MAPSPSKYKTFHKSSGKIFRQKDKNNTGNGSSSSSFNNGGCNGGSGNSSSGNNGSHSTIRKDEIVELKDCPLTLPDVTPLDHTRSLPRFNGLVMGEGVTMEELDGLQLELELLLSSMLVRQMALSHQIDVIQQMEKGKLPPRMAATPGKRLRQNDTDGVSRPLKKLKDVSGKAREILPLPGPPPSNKPPKVKCSVIKNEPLFDVPDLGPPEAPKPPPGKNDITNKFWQMNLKILLQMLEELLNSQNDDAEYMKIPPLGRHYTLRWAQEDLLDEQKESSKLADTKKKIKTDCNDDVAPMGPLTQRIISGLVEENVITSENIENKVQGLGVGRPGFIKSLSLGNAASLEKRIKKELQEQGIIEGEGMSEEEDDEILFELKRCQAELKAVTSHNHSQLTRLLRLAREALVRHDLKKKLRDADAKVIEAYRTIAATKQKKKVPTKKDKEVAIKAVKEREALVRQLDLISSS